MIANGLLKNRQRSLRYLVLLQLAELGLVKFRFGNVNVLTAKRVNSVGYKQAEAHTS